MKIIRHEVLLCRGSYFQTKAFQDVIQQIETAIKKVVWPLGNHEFAINPTRKGNGVKPIKNDCMTHLEEEGWDLETRLAISSEMRPGPLDATRIINDHQAFAVEWETGNISSSHRAVNKMALGILEGVLLGGILILPSRKMYDYLTDRVGNFKELAPYFNVWKKLDVAEGYLGVIEIEHDVEQTDSPLIAKGTDGWAQYVK